MNGRLIIAVDDEADILELVAFNLGREGFRVKTADSGEGGLSLINSPGPRPDLILLDLMLPGIDGLTLCRRLKTQPETRDIPIIMLTAKSEEADIVTGLELGADDYIAKPFSPKVLIARIRAVLRARDDLRAQAQVPAPVEAQPPAGNAAEAARRGDHASTQLIRVGLISIDIPRHEVFCDGRAVALSATEFAILEFLARNPGWVFSRNRIIDGVKGKDYPVTERSVDVQILGLRKKLGVQGEYIQTVRGVGYRLQVP